MLDYFSFGMPMPGRQTVGGETYRYAFQGQEKDPETGKEAFQLRLWDSRIGRWLTTDPYGQYASPYLGMGNDPINGVDPDGGYRTKWGRFWGWVGGGFKGSLGANNPNASDPNKRYGIQFAETTSFTNTNGGFEQELTISTVYDNDGLTMRNLDSYDRSILANGGVDKLAANSNRSLRWKLDKLKVRDWRENIAPVYQAQRELGLYGSGLYGGNTGKIAPAVGKTINNSVQKTLSVIQITGDEVIHLNKVRLIDNTHNIYKRFPPQTRRFLYPAQKGLIRERNKLRNFMNTENFETIMSFFE